MKLDKTMEVKIEIIINNSLYKKNIIDVDTFYIVNDELLKKLK